MYNLLCHLSTLNLHSISGFKLVYGNILRLSGHFRAKCRKSQHSVSMAYNYGEYFLSFVYFFSFSLQAFFYIFFLNLIVKYNINNKLLIFKI
uniref:Uncharacterized protein n=1 Tax=Glossina morsitans morsitans TaxID=37546 RepID=A0A1B0FMN5_GLOMM